MSRLKDRSFFQSGLLSITRRTPGRPSNSSSSGGKSGMMLGVALCGCVSVLVGCGCALLRFEYNALQLLLQYLLRPTASFMPQLIHLLINHLSTHPGPSYTPLTSLISGFLASLGLSPTFIVRPSPVCLISCL